MDLDLSELLGKTVASASGDGYLLIEFTDGTWIEANGGCAQGDSVFEIELGPEPGLAQPPR